MSKVYKSVLVLSCLLAFVSGCRDTALVKRARVCLGTVVEITVADQDKPRPFILQTIDSAFVEIERVESLLSRFKPESDISRINKWAGQQPIKVHPLTLTLMEKAIFFSRLTKGAFDITIGPLQEAWGLDKEGTPRIPAEQQLKAVLSRVGYQHIQLLKEEQAVYLPRAQMILDLGGIAKGYAVDRAVSILRQAGIRHALVNAGGDIYALGGSSKVRKWQVALEHPRKQGVYLTVLELADQAVATSGDYRQYVEIEGERFSHILNPRSGYPCAKVPASVTIIATDCVSADALATGVFVLGPRKGIELVNRLANTEAIIAVVSEGQLEVLVSQGLQGRLKFNL